MVTINYLRSESGLFNCFAYSFLLKEYIPHKYFQISENGVGAELYYFIDLLKQNNMFDCKKNHYHQMIWSYHYDCIYNRDIPFTMVYDEDYDMVSFSVSEEHMSFKEEIAQAIKSIIKTTKTTV